MPNELQFLRSENFRQMAPPILRLEVDRLGRLIEALPADLEARNALVRARFALTRFIEELGDATHLEAILMNLALLDGRLEPGQQAVLRYIADRIQYVHDRLPLLY